MLSTLLSLTSKPTLKLNIRTTVKFEKENEPTLKPNTITSIRIEKKG